MGTDLAVLRWLVLAAMAAYAVATLALTFRARRAGWAAFATAFAAAAAAFAWRWATAGHAPMRNLFEVFLTMGMLALPISVFCRLVLRVGLEAGDAIMGLLLLAPVAFVFDPSLRPLPRILQSPYFIPHVSAYLVAYVVIAKAALQAAGRLMAGARGRQEGCVRFERGTERMVRLAFPLLTLGLVLGAIWGQQAWGGYWHWDPKELWSLATWLAFLGYLHIRATIGRRYGRAQAALVLTGTALVLVTLLWANLSRLFAGLHSYAV